ncbi:MAG: DUF4198 domain-containing protein [Deltaproteobacteria bacterium]|jgi:uncharacterized GH25 family protein|nr:DUF4198 domain-containing protein [Deltaproteobacteria bacterium]
MSNTNLSRLLTAALAAVFCLGFSAAAQAHSLWLETDSSSMPADQPEKIIVGFNEGFEVVDILENSVPEIAAPIIIGKSGEIKTKLSGDKNYDFVTEQPLPAGSYVGFTDYKPFLMGHGKDAPKNKYFMTGKSVFNVGGAKDTEFITKPQAKAALEIIPLSNPADLKAGGSMKVQVLFEGKPITRATVLGDFRGFNPAGSWGMAKAFYCNTDKEGQVDFLPVKDGLWVLKVRHAVPNTDKDNKEFADTVHLASLTFFVGQ